MRKVKKEMSKFGNSLGVLELELSGEQYELKPDMKDVKKFRTIMMLEANRKDKNLLFDRFSDYMFEMFKKAYPSDDDDAIKIEVELHLMVLFEEMMIAFKWTTREESDKLKKETVQELKKSIGEN